MKNIYGIMAGGILLLAFHTQALAGDMHIMPVLPKEPKPVHIQPVLPKEPKPVVIQPVLPKK